MDENSNNYNNAAPSPRPDNAEQALGRHIHAIRAAACGGAISQTKRHKIYEATDAIMCILKKDYGLNTF